MSITDCALCNLKVFKRAIRQVISHSAGNLKQDGQTEWQVGTHHLLFHWRGSETEGITVLCKVIQEVRVKHRVKAKLHENSSEKPA